MYFSIFPSRRRSQARAVAIGKATLPGGPRPLRIEPLEQRTLLSAVAVFDHVIFHRPPVGGLSHSLPAGGAALTPAFDSPPASALTPAQIQTAYGTNAISLGGVAGTGSGQTIAIVDAYDDPNIVSDTAAFNTQFGLQQFNVVGGPTLTVLNQTGGTTPPTASGTSGWSVEESLDVQIAHTIAPQANIILFEANSASDDLYTAVQTAAAYPGVSVVSMSWGGDEFDGENAYDSYFTTPAGHENVTFLASTGDYGSPGEYPAYSPNVVAVGGTTLNLNANNTYKSETAWSGSGGGQSSYEPEPAYQLGVQDSGSRQIPDVAFDADPSSGVDVYDSYDYPSSPWLQVGGTSVAAPAWGGFIAIANQLRASRGLGSLGGLSQTLPTLYSLDAADFHDITTGSNGYSAGFGYDMVTGLGSPVANQLLPDLALYPAGTVTNPATTVTLSASTYAPQYSQSITFSATVGKIDPGVVAPTGTVTFEDGGTPIGTVPLARGMAVFNASPLSLGSHTITAVYGGNGTFTSNASSPLVEVVTPLVTGTSLHESASSTTYGQAETLTATVSDLLSGAPTPTGGTVTFTDQATSAVLGTATLTEGTAAMAISSLTAGTHGITATYHGDGHYFQGSSGSLPFGTIGALAGNGLPSYSGDGGLATAAQLDLPYDVAVDSAGDVFIADSGNNLIREVNATTHDITIYAGNGTAGYSGNGGLATNAELYSPSGIALDSAGDLFIADTFNSVIREVNVTTHIITTVAGTPDVFYYGGDGGPATNAYLYAPYGIAVDSSGDLFIADTFNNRIREVAAGTKDISTYAGNGTGGYSGDGGPATAAELYEPTGLALDAGGNLFIADYGNNVIRKVTPGTQGIISTVAGNGTAGYSGDGGLATSAELGDPFGIAVDAGDDLFIADTFNNVIRKVTAGTQDIISTLAGNGTAGDSGDGGLATSAELDQPGGVALDSHGNLFIADYYSDRVREITASTKDISTVAGGGVPASVPPTSFSVTPYSVALDSSGDLFIADATDDCIDEVLAGTGAMITYAGDGIAGYSGNGGLATSAELDYPYGIALDSSGDLFIADTFNNVIREVNASTHIITTVAGNGTAGYSGDGGPAISAELYDPTGVAVDAAGNLFIADINNNCVRKVTASTKDISTYAGNGTQGYSGDGGPATSAELYWPSDVAVDANDNVYIADYGNSRIREVTAGTQDIISTVAGNGTAGYSGDTGPAASAELDYPFGIALDSAGDLFIADTGNSAIREVTAGTQAISTVAGNGNYGSGGDGGPAAAAQLAAPQGVAVDSSGNLYIADTGNYAVRQALPPIITVAPAPLTITANNQTKAYGAALPALTISYDGFVNGDTPASLAVQPALSTTATASSPVGSYAINVSGAVDPNYDISYVSGTLSVTPIVATVSSVVANAGPTAGGTAVTITGTNLNDVAAVYFGATAVSQFTIESKTQIVTTSPAGAAGTVDVTVLTGGGNSATSSADWFRYVAPPTVSSIGATSGSVFGNTPVNIYGSNLADATAAVFFGTTPAAAFSIISPTQILAFSPPGTGTVNVTVVTVGGASQDAPAVQFTYVPVTLTWDGAATGNWTDAQWTGPDLPYPDDRANAIIGSGSVVQVTSRQAANALSIQSNAQLVVGSGAALSVTTDTTVTDGSVLSVDPNGSFSSSGTVTLDTGGKLSGGPVVAAAYELDDGTASADLSGRGGLTKDTAGRVVLTGENSYAGGTVVKDGTLIVTNSNALPAGSSLAVGAAASTIFDSAPAAASTSAVGLAATAATSAAANETSTPIVAASSPSSAPVTASALSTVSPARSATPLAPAGTPAPSPTALLRRREARAATPPISPPAIDAVIKADHSAVEHSAASPDHSQSASLWAWLAVADKNRASGMAAAALDKVLAKYGL